jgi:predicted alpha/beta-fold hydrolase
LADGDALAVHDTTPAAWRPGAPVVLLVHGLGGCHRSFYLQRLTNQFTDHGLRAVRVDLRGAGAGVRLARRVYNAACASDVRAVGEFLLRQTPDSPLLLVGYSLGGNIVLNLAGDAATKPLPGLRAVAAVSPPVDLVQCSAMLATLPFYDRYYARNLRLQVRQHELHFPGLPTVHFPRALTMRRFDDLYTAPRGGFADAMDYYRRASSWPVIPEIQVPTFILSARDDPFIAVKPLERLQGHTNLQIHLVPKGGHLGFLGRDGAGGVRWGEQRVVDWILAHV